MIPEIVTLAEAKSYLRVDHDDDDEQITGLIATATEEALCLADSLDPAEVTAENAPPVVRTAILLHVSRLYDDRDDGKVPAGTVALASRHRSWDV